MTTRNIELTEELDRFIAKKVEQGRYQDANAVVHAALCSLRLEEEREKRAALRTALEEGLASGVAEGDVFARVRQKVGLPPEN